MSVKDVLAVTGLAQSTLYRQVALLKRWGFVTVATDMTMTDYHLRPHQESTEETLDRLRRAVKAADIGTFFCALPLGRLYWNAHCKTHFWLAADTPDADVDIDMFCRVIDPEDRERVRVPLMRPLPRPRPATSNSARSLPIVISTGTKLGCSAPTGLNAVYNPCINVGL